MMGDVRNQGHHHNHGRQMQVNYNTPGLVRPAKRYPTQHMFGYVDDYGPSVNRHPAPFSNNHPHQYRTFQTRGHNALPISHPGVTPVDERLQSQPNFSGPQKSMSPLSHDAAVPMQQSQPTPQFSANRYANNNTQSATNSAIPKNLNHESNINSTIESNNPNQQLTQRQAGSGPTSVVPEARQDREMIVQEPRLNHHDFSSMHKPYSAQHPQQQQQHGQYGGQSYMHHRVYPNSMHADLQNLKHRQSPLGGVAPPLIHRHYHGHLDRGVSVDYRIQAGRKAETHLPGSHHRIDQERPNNHWQPHLPHPPPLNAKHGFQLPKYDFKSATDDSRATAAEGLKSTQPLSTDPSPPPSPPPAPSAQALLRQKLREQGAKKKTMETVGTNMPGSSTDPKASESTSLSEALVTSNNSSNNHFRPIALGDRGNVPTDSSLDPKADSSNMKNTSKQEDITADAASILLQLGSVIKRSSDNSENRDPSGQTTSEKEVMLALKTDALDLKSEPSTDSMESGLSEAITAFNKQKVDTDFPCAVPDRYPTRLALPDDNTQLNALHCFLRTELLEVFVVRKSNRKSPCHSPSSSVGRVGLRCVHCAMLRRTPQESREDAPMAVFYPKSIAEIYRLVTSWQRCHLRKCKNVPPAVRNRWQTLRETDRSRGKTHYWVTSAKQIGLMDCQSRSGGIRFVPNFDPKTLPIDTKLTPSSSEIAKKAASIAAAMAGNDGDNSNVLNT